MKEVTLALGLLFTTLCTLSTYYNTSTLISMLDDPAAVAVSDTPIMIQPLKSPRPLPRWGDTVNDEERNGIQLAPILDFILNSSTAAYAPKWPHHDPAYIPTSDHKDDVNYWFPETLYVVDGRGIWTSRLHRTIAETGKGSVKDKNIPAEEHMAVTAWRLLKDDANNKDTKYSRLREILKTPGGGFPFLAWYGDFTGCNYRNWKDEYSIPLFTTAAAVDCNYAFPFPTYRTIRDSKVSSQEWDDIMKHRFAVRYPWEHKKRQIVWRGSLTGKILNATHKSPRWNLVQMMHKNSLFDVGATRLPPRHSNWQSHLNEVGGLVESLPMEDFQKYRGILDVDGNSWSSRFGLLLCYNSVILKVQPSYVDHFYFKRADDDSGLPELQPWKHFIPVKSDLSDLVDLAKFVADPVHDEQLQTIVRQANAWCRRNMVHESVAHDMLEIWERYVELLDIANPNWSEKQWKAAKERIFSAESSLDMIRITDD